MSDPPLLIADLLPSLVQTALYTLTSLALATQFTPYLRNRLLGYGKTIQTSTTSSSDSNSSKATKTETGKGTKNPIEWLFTTTVPHSWFLHFYVLALTLMGGIVANILLPRQLSPLKTILAVEIPTAVVEHPYFQAFAGGVMKEGRGRGGLDWWVIACVTAQVGRRLWEDFTLGGKVWSERDRERMWLGGEIVLVKEDPTGAEQEKKTATDKKDNGEKNPPSRMPLPIYISGLLFYTLLPLSTITPATHTLLTFTAPHIPLSPFSLLSVPPTYIFLLLPPFLILSGTQHDIHIYLSTLIKYTLPPARSWFRYTLAPHYTVEAGIYGLLVLMAYFGAAGGEGAGAMLAVMVFVWMNLTLLGGRQRAWYGERFGEEKVRGRGGMWPVLW